MAEMILRAGWPLFLWARRHASLEPFRGTAAQPVGSLPELGEACDLVGVCVFDDADVEEVVLGDDGLLRGMRPGAVLAIHSTVHPATCRHLAGVAAVQGVDVLDAPVSGGRVGALNRTLAVMVGGKAAAIERAAPVMRSFGDPVRLVGPVGSGQTLKLLNNVLAFANIRLAADALGLARRFELDEDAAIEVLRAGGARSFGLEVFLQLRPENLEKDMFAALAADRGARGALQHAERASAKDVGLFQALARERGIPVSTVERAGHECVDVIRTLQTLGSAGRGGQ
jgi:3-hydroxyisobutyrate dehydrogenase-like beta-hydroxyacid dehydrogenase